VTRSTKRSAKGELVFTSFLFVVGVIVLWDASQLPELGIADFVGSGTFPSIVGWALVVLAGIQLVSVFRGDLGQPEEVEGARIETKIYWKPFLMMLGGLLFFAFSVSIIGFPIAATVLFTSVVYALKPGATKWFVVVPIAAATALVTHFGFTLGLQIDLPLWLDFNNFGTTEVIVEEDW
jgi:putative tricarboxylic transport membrane protein